MKDGISNLALVATVAPAVQTATVKGTAVDLQGYGSATAIINTGAIAGSGKFTATLQESDTTTDGDFADVAAADLLGDAFPSAGLAATTVYKQGYIGTKRYLRVVLTLVSGTSIAAGAVIALGHPASAPVA